jgi:hypothetical protein
LRLQAVDPSADPRVSDWIDGLLSVEPEQRPQTAAAAWAELEEIVLDRLGSRCRHAAALGPVATAPVMAATPATLAVSDGTRVDDRVAATARPRTTRARPRPAATASGGGARRLARGLLLLMALAVLAAGALSLSPGGGSRPAAEPPGAAPRSAPAADKRAQRRAAPAPSGVGDSQSDDPSDDAPDGGEP